MGRTTNTAGELSREVERELRLWGYSPRTRKAYLHHVDRYVHHFMKDPRQLGEAHLREYLLHLIEKERVSRAYHDQAVSALKFLYDRVIKTPRVIRDIPRPRKEKKLPIVLSQEEVLRLLKCVENPKHRAIMMLVYSAGLRPGEAVRLKVEDIDSQRHLIRVHRAKGRKDRYTVLSNIALDALREYWRIYKPKRWLFPGPKPDNHITTRTVGKMFEDACKKAGITKHATVTHPQAQFCNPSP